MSRSISLVILVCCACSIHTASLVQPVTNQSANRTNLLLSTASSVPSATSPRKLSMVDHTLIVHLISSQVNSHSASLHKSSQSNSQSNQLGTANSTNASDQFQNNPALSCADGQTYWDPIESQCVNCSSSCPTGAYVSRVCNRTHDLECQCHKGSYMSVMDKTCKPCAECPFGWGVWRTCRWSRNTVCRKCQPGTYSGASVGTLGCIPCSKCGPNQEMISECDGNRDTVCVDRMALRANFSLYFPSFSAQRNGILPNGPSSQLIGNDEFEDEDRSSYPEATIYSSPQSVHNYALPFYFAILVVIVFAICIYALVQLRCSEVINGRSGMLTTQADHKHMMFNQTGGMLTPKVVATGALPYTMPSPYYHHQASIQPVWSYENDYPLANQQYSTVMHLYTSSQRCKAPGRVELSEGVIRNGSSGSSKSRPKYKAYYELLYAPNEMPQCNEPLLTNGQQHLTTDMIEALERRLASDSISWRMLARELGFNDKQIGEFETKSTTLQTTDSTVPQQTTVTVDTAKVTRLLLTDWWQIVDTSEDSTAPTHERSLQNEQPQVVASKADSVAVLVKALTRIGRVDCARLVQNHHKKASPSPSPSTLSSSCSLSQDR